MDLPIIKSAPQSVGQSPQVLTKEQLAKQAEVRKQKGLIKEKLQPFLEVSCKDLTEAVSLLELAKMGIEGAWANKKNRSTLKSLDIVKGMSDKAPEYKKVKFLIDTLEEETVGDSVHILASLKELINTYGGKEISKQPMTVLKTYFSDDFKD